MKAYAIGTLLLGISILAIWVVLDRSRNQMQPSTGATSDHVQTQDSRKSQEDTSDGDAPASNGRGESASESQYVPRFGNLISRPPSWRPVHTREAIEAMDSTNMGMLVDRALDGNPYAARFLSQIEGPCEEAPKTEQELESRIEDFRQSRIYDETLTEGYLLADDDKSQRVINQMNVAYERCTSLRKHLDGKDADFLRLAAENGDPVAMIEYGNRIVSSDLALARSNYVRSWGEGVIYALESLSEVEQMRFDAGLSPDGNISSAAHYLAFVALHEARSHRRGQRMPSEFFTVISARVDDIYDSLLPHQRPVAENLAKEIINSNDNCCFE